MLGFLRSRPARPDPEAFARAEWEENRVRRARVERIVGRIEFIGLIGYALFFAWFLIGFGVPDGLIRVFVLLAGATFLSVMLLLRLKAEYATLMTLNDYGREIENYVYAKGAAPVGWQNYCALPAHDPSNKSLSTVFGQYRIAGAVFTLLVLGNVTLFITANIPFFERASRRFVEAFAALA